MQILLNMLSVAGFLRHFQHCCACGCPTLRASHLCEGCFGRLQILLQSDPLGQTQARNPDSDSITLALGLYTHPILAALVHVLKGGDPWRNDVGWIAKAWLRQRHLRVLPPMRLPVAIVSAPSRRGFQLDHSGQLAQALSEISGWPHLKILVAEPDASPSQKSRSAQQRRQRRFKCNRADIGDYDTFIFVDDVVTTGSTAQAAWHALGSPKGFEVWCLAYQPRLAAQK